MSLDKTAIDVGRRDLQLSGYIVDDVLPAFFQEDYPKLISLLNRYFESLEDESNPANNLKDLLTIRDINQVKERLLSFIGEEVLLSRPYFENFADKRTSIEFSNLLYRSKGTKYSIEQFFRIFFDTDAVVEYPKNDIFFVGQVSRETLEYVSKGVLTGNNFPYEHQGTLTVSITSNSGKSLELREDIDYTVDTSKKVLSIIRDPGTVDSYLQADSDFIFLVDQGYPRINNVLKLDTLMPNSSLIGFDLQQKKLQDNKLYQLFSLLITTPFSKDLWGDAYEKFAHPAGMYFGSQVIVLSDFDLNLGEQINATQDPLPFLVFNEYNIIDSDSLTYTDMTSIISDSAESGNSSGLVRSYADQNIRTLSDYTSLQLNRQYPSILELIKIEPPTMDQDSSGNGLSRDSDSYIDISNAIDKIDRNFYEDSSGSLSLT